VSIDRNHAGTPMGRASPDTLRKEAPHRMGGLPPRLFYPVFPPIIFLPGKRGTESTGAAPACWV